VRRLLRRTNIPQEQSGLGGRKEQKKGGSGKKRGRFLRESTDNQQDHDNWIYRSGKRPTRKHDLVPRLVPIPLGFACKENLGSKAASGGSAAGVINVKQIVIEPYRIRQERRGTKQRGARERRRRLRLHYSKGKLLRGSFERESGGSRESPDQIHQKDRRSW